MSFGPLCINPKLFPSAKKCKIATEPLVLCAETDFSTVYFLIKNKMMKSNVATDIDGNRLADVAPPGTLPLGQLGHCRARGAASLASPWAEHHSPSIHHVVISLSCHTSICTAASPHPSKKPQIGKKPGNETVGLVTVSLRAGG